MKNRCQRVRLGLLLTSLSGLSLLVACGGGGGGGGSGPSMMAPPPVGDSNPIPPPLDPTGQAPGELFAVTSSNRLVTFNPGASAASTNLPITGLGSGERTVGIDARTLDGTVFVVSDLGVVYTLDPRSGTAARLAALPNGAAGRSFGVEFIGAGEELRLVNGAGESFRVTGFGAVTSSLQPAITATMRFTTQSLPSGISEIAGTQNAVRCGAQSSLYYLDTLRDRLLMDTVQGAQTSTREVGPLGLDAQTASGFEIFQRPDRSDAAVAVLQVGGAVSLYDIDLSTGRATVRSPVPGLRAIDTVVGLTRLPSLSFSPRLGDTVAVTVSGKLITFDELAPLALCREPTAIAGLQDRERILDIDVRAADGVLYGVSDAGRIYTLSTQLSTLGAATFKSKLQADPGDSTSPFTGNVDPAISIDFDPRDDRLIATDSANQLLSIDVDQGLVTTSDPMPTEQPNRLLPARFGSFGPSPDIARNVLIAGLNANLATDPAFGPAIAADIRGGEGLNLVALQPPSLDRTLLSSFVFNQFQPKLIGGGERVRAVAALQNLQATVFALTTDNRLLRFKPTTPSQPDASAQISGLQSDETLLAIDFRAADGALYGLSDRGRIYVINVVSGVAVLKSVLTPSAGDSNVQSLVGLTADMSFNPISGMLRIATSGGRSLRVDVDTGAVASDANLRRSDSKPPKFTGISYLQPSSGDTEGKLLLLDSANNRVAGLLRQGVTDPGAVREIRRLGRPLGDIFGVVITDVLGFDVDSDGNLFVIATTMSDRVALFDQRSETDFDFLNNRGPIALPATDHITGFATRPDGDTFYAITNLRQFISFTSADRQASVPQAVTGLAADEVLLSIDFDSSGRLVGLGSTARLYFIDPATASATLAQTLSGPALSGTRFDMDFDPISGALTIVSDTAQLLTVDANGSASAQSLHYAAAAAIPFAHSSSFAGPRRTSTTDFGELPFTSRLFIDTVSASLQIQNGPGDADGEPRDGEITTLAPILPLADFGSFAPLAAFDVIGGADALSLAALRPDSSSQSMLYSITTRPRAGGAVGRAIGPIGVPGTAPVRGLAIRLQ